MLIVLLRSQSDVRERLFQCVESCARPLLVAQERDLALGGPFERRQPYRYLLDHQAAVSLVLVADDGLGGLWRDPLGELAARQFDPPDVPSAVSGYMLFRMGLEPTYLKRDLWDPLTDVDALIARLRLDIPTPEKVVSEPAHPRGKHGHSAEEGIPTDPGVTPPYSAPKYDDANARKRPGGGSGPRPAIAVVIDPFAVLGLLPGADEDTARKAFHTLIVQYHPDKVAHLAPEFQVLAEEKTRALTEAYDRVQRILRGEPLDA